MSEGAVTDAVRSRVLALREEVSLEVARATALEVFTGAAQGFLALHPPGGRLTCVRLILRALPIERDDLFRAMAQ